MFVNGLPRLSSHVLMFADDTRQIYAGKENSSNTAMSRDQNTGVLVMNGKVAV